MAVPAPETVVINGHLYSLDQFPDEKSPIVLSNYHFFLELFDLETVVTNLSRVGEFIRIAYNGVGAAGPEFTTQQIAIQRLGYDITKLCDKIVLTVTKFKKALRSIVIELQATYAYLLDSLEEMAVKTLSNISKIAEDLQKAALELDNDFDQEAEKVFLTLEKAELKFLEQKQCKTEENMSIVAVDPHEAAGAVCVVMSKATQFWKYMQEHCKSIARFNMQSLVEKAIESYDSEKRLKFWTSKSFMMKMIMFYAEWVALHGVCNVYMQRIKITQKELYKYITENPTWEQSRDYLPELAAKFQAILLEDEKANKAQEEIKSLKE